MNLFAERLAGKWEDRDVLTGIRSLEEFTRQEGETAWPDLGMFQRACEAARIARVRIEGDARNRVLVRWQCPDCKTTATGFRDRFGYMERRCKGMGRIRGKDRAGKERVAIMKDLICHARMDVVYMDQDEILPPSALGMVKVGNFEEIFDKARLLDMPLAVAPPARIRA